MKLESNFNSKSLFKNISNDDFTNSSKLESSAINLIKFITSKTCFAESIPLSRFCSGFVFNNLIKALASSWIKSLFPTNDLVIETTAFVNSSLKVSSANIFCSRSLKSVLVLNNSALLNNLSKINLIASAIPLVSSALFKLALIKLATVLSFVSKTKEAKLAVNSPFVKLPAIVKNISFNSFKLSFKNSLVKSDLSKENKLFWLNSDLDTWLIKNGKSIFNFSLLAFSKLFCRLEIEFGIKFESYKNSKNFSLLDLSLADSGALFNNAFNLPCGSKFLYISLVKNTSRALLVIKLNICERATILFPKLLVSTFWFLQMMLSHHFYLKTLR